MRTACLVLLSLAVARGQQSKPATGKDVELRKAIAVGLAELAQWCGEKKLNAEGRALAEEALGLDPDNAKAKGLKPKLTGDSSAAKEPDRAEYAKKAESYGKRLSQLYRDLFAQKHAAGQQAQWDGYLLRAFEWDAKATGPVLEAEWREAYGKKDWPRTAALVAAAEKVKSDPARAKVLRECELRAAEKTAIKRRCTTHRMEYYLALPKDWTPAKRYPILVAVEGAGCNWMGMMNGHLGVRGDRPLILVVPITFSNTNALVKEKYPYEQEVLDEADRKGRIAFDEPGLLGVLDDVRREFSGQEKFFITGFSGGGNLTFRMTFGHPEKLIASAPACPNFAGSGKVSEAPERENLPVKCFQGDKDEYLNALEAQWQAALRLFEQHGYKNVSRVMLPGVGHSGCAKEVQEFFAPLIRVEDVKPEKK